ncbi:helix-turn-helix domain-containing protein [Proteus mirabilis]|uniref:helix-turn-helix domain-containing protein n=1 Tax=Proteus mirabilis TaxID=584 RepID=UPI000502F09E|nr:helix-turn-helix transcriptional regulator [Proteus mirabilis]KGA92345.1 helix-turn-helix family protein [Proteus mirabilis]MDF7306014.1 helix-turn-helix domain-containing protein [Proteus mirabilis]MDM3645204.1 helix-turn-helix transcriptional regulator [Proteus mirabilis]MDM3813106.1 helix-turn-helix transcriptional regulator [Proteus mirabilis]
MNTIESTTKRTAVVFPKHKKVLSILGENLTLAMKRRGITQEMMHNRTGLSKPTLRKILKGDPSVSLGHYVNVLASLGLLEDLTKVAFDDELGRKLQDIQLLKKNKGIALWKSTFMLIGLNQLTLY